jgi:hypothetical protein
MGQLITYRKLPNNDLEVILRRSGMPRGNVYGSDGDILMVIARVYHQDIEDAVVVINEINRQRWEMKIALREMILAADDYYRGEGFPLHEIVSRVQRTADELLKMLGEDS